MTSQSYSQLVRYKQWADRGLYDVVGQNLDRLDTQDAAIMLRILDHMHVVDRIFQHHLQGLPHTFKAPRSEEMPKFQALVKSVREIDDWYASYVGNLAENDFEQPVDFVFTSGKQACRDHSACLPARNLSQGQCWRRSSIERHHSEP
jgi:hypothetical protein